MNSQVVSVSPIAAHFLLRSRLEQALMVGGAAVLAGPWVFAMGAFAFVGISEGDMAHVPEVLWIGALVALPFAWLGWKVGTMLANVVAVVRARRAMVAAGTLR